MANEWVPHVVKEGSREHVTHWDSLGAHCSEPMCVMNRPVLRPDQMQEVISALVREGAITPEMGERMSAFVSLFAASIADDKDALAAAVAGLLEAACACTERTDPNDVLLDEVPGHHDFSCEFRRLMQPVLHALAQSKT